MSFLTFRGPWGSPSEKLLPKMVSNGQSNLMPFEDKIVTSIYYKCGKKQFW